MSAHEWAAWAALGLSLIMLAGAVGVVVLAAWFWRKVAPTVAPMLAMFGASPASPVDVPLGRLADVLEDAVPESPE